jgi:mediator of RNA polymerase II transcription subunit 6
MEGDDLTGVTWTDKVWLTYFPLNAETVLDYFSLSQFYDRACNNELVKMQRLDPALMSTMEGIEYTLVPSSSLTLFRIAKSRRAITPQPSVTLLAVYYIVNGVVYQAPTAHAVLSSRILQSLHYVRDAFDIMQRHAVPEPALLSSKRNWDPPPTPADALAQKAQAEPITQSDAGLLEKKTMDRILFDILDKNRRIAEAAAAVGDQPTV